MFDIKRNRNNELVIVVSWQKPTWHHQFFPNFTIGQKVKKHLLLFSTALGLSLGVSLVIFSQPAFTTATLDHASALPTVTASSFKIHNHEFKLSTQQDFNLVNLNSNNICFNDFCQLHSNQPTLIFTTHQLEEVSLGDKIEAIGKNNGIYHYQVTQIINSPSQELLAQASQFPNKLIIAYPENIWRTSLQLIIAQ